MERSYEGKNPMEFHADTVDTKDTSDKDPVQEQTEISAAMPRDTSKIDLLPQGPQACDDSQETPVQAEGEKDEGLPGDASASKGASLKTDSQIGEQTETGAPQGEILHDHSKDFEQEPKDGKEIKTDHTDYQTITKAMEEASKEEKEHLKSLPVTPEKIDDRASLVRTDVDLLALDDKGECNLDRMQKKKPMLKDGKPIELHHIGQKMDAPLAELTMEEHRGQGNDAIFHDKTQPTEIDRKAFAAERRHYWATRAQEEIRKEIEKVKSGV